MSLPPERISIKRRRQDEPVDTLILEQGSAHDKKRRFTDFFFKRLRRDETPRIVIKSPDVDTAGPSASQTAGVVDRDNRESTVPIIKASAPGDEISDFVKYKNEQRRKIQEQEETSTKIAAVQHSSLLSGAPISKPRRQPAKPTRRFHLTRDISSLLKPNPVSGIRRPKLGLRPPLATFIERTSPRQGNENTIYNQPPIDSIVELNDEASVASNNGGLTDTMLSKKTQVSTFLKTAPSGSRYGNSIHDDPMTWDYESDQLANELAALAFDIDPADATEPPQVLPVVTTTTSSTKAPDIAQDHDMTFGADDDFVFETYIRVKHDLGEEAVAGTYDTEIGVLVIDNENEDLWEKYIQSDDDDDNWDEEDEDSNAEDNPRNEYPDDEVSSDDEYGRNVYRHRRNASDDEEYDAKDDW